MPSSELLGANNSVRMILPRQAQSLTTYSRGWANEQTAAHSNAKRRTPGREELGANYIFSPTAIYPTRSQGVKKSRDNGRDLDGITAPHILCLGLLGSVRTNRTNRDTNCWQVCANRTNRDQKKLKFLGKFSSFTVCMVCTRLPTVCIPVCTGLYSSCTKPSQSPK